MHHWYWLTYQLVRKSGRTPGVHPGSEHTKIVASQNIGHIPFLLLSDNLRKYKYSSKVYFSQFFFSLFFLLVILKQHNWSWMDFILKAAGLIPIFHSRSYFVRNGIIQITCLAQCPAFSEWWTQVTHHHNHYHYHHHPHCWSDRVVTVQVQNEQNWYEHYNFTE